MSTHPHDQAYANTEWSIESGEPSYNNPGLTKRELFAAMAMQGIQANPDCSGWAHADIAGAAVRAADALIAELNK
jgi:hypothetical protein